MAAAGVGVSTTTEGSLTGGATGSAAGASGVGLACAFGVRMPLNAMRSPSGDQATSAGKTPVRS
jgi:hypothetical protein